MQDWIAGPESMGDLVLYRILALSCIILPNIGLAHSCNYLKDTFALMVLQVLELSRKMLFLDLAKTTALKDLVSISILQRLNEMS